MTREYGIAKARAQHGVLLGLLLLAIGITCELLAPRGDAITRFAGIAVLAAGLGVSLHAWRRLRGDAVYLRIDDEGVWLRDWGAAASWHQVAAAYPTGSRLQGFVALRLADPALFLAGLSAAEAKALRGNRLWKSPELRIPNGAVAATQAEILDAIGAALREHAERTRDGAI